MGMKLGIEQTRFGSKEDAIRAHLAVAAGPWRLRISVALAVDGTATARANLP